MGGTVGVFVAVGIGEGVGVVVCVGDGVGGRIKQEGRVATPQLYGVLSGEETPHPSTESHPAILPVGSEKWVSFVKNLNPLHAPHVVLVHWWHVEVSGS